MKELKIIKSSVFSSCSSEEFTCTDGVCIDLIKRFFVFICICLLLCSRRTTLSRCDNLNDCRDKSDEANCKRVGGVIEYKYMLISLYMCFVPICALFQVKMVPTYQKFIVPPPLMTDNMTKVRIISSLKLCYRFSHIDGYMVSLFITEYFVPIDTELLFNKLSIFCLAPFFVLVQKFRCSSIYCL